MEWQPIKTVPHSEPVLVLYLSQLCWNIYHTAWHSSTGKFAGFTHEANENIKYWIPVSQLPRFPEPPKEELE